MLAIRACSEKDSIIRVCMDTSAHSVVSFTARWAELPSRTHITRRVYLQTKLNEDGGFALVFMAKVFDEKAVVKNYAADKLDWLTNDVMRYLRIGVLPQ